jgi:MFS family permease
MPVFLVGAFGSVIQEELAVDEARLGLTVAVGFGSGALASGFLGRRVEHVGARRGFALALALAATALLGVATLGRTWPMLALFVAVGGLGNGLAQPSSNLALAHSAPARPGLVFGAKQSGAPAATLVAGAAVPVVGATVGWRWAFAAVAGLAALMASALPRELPDRRGSRGDVAASPDVDVRLLVGLAAAGGIGVAAATSLASFVVGSAVAGGARLDAAGWLLSVGSVAAIVARLFMGSVADRRGRGSLVLVSGMLLSGAVGFLLLAAGGPNLVWIGTVLAFAGGWGWTGLLMFATVRLCANAPATATGIVQAGAATGAALGPFAFGALVTRSSYATAWRSAALAASVSAVLILLVRSRILAGRPQG